MFHGPPPSNLKKKMLMPLRGLRDLQFTVNYFNQIISPLLLGVQLLALGEWKFSFGGRMVTHWEVPRMEKDEATGILE